MIGVGDEGSGVGEDWGHWSMGGMVGLGVLGGDGGLGGGGEGDLRMREVLTLPLWDEEWRVQLAPLLLNWWYMLRSRERWVSLAVVAILDHFSSFIVCFVISEV